MNGLRLYSIPEASLVIVLCVVMSSLNANDFFGYACADAVELDTVDLSWVIPIVKKYGVEGVEACMSYIRQCFSVREIRTERF